MKNSKDNNYVWISLYDMPMAAARDKMESAKPADQMMKESACTG